MFLKEEKQASKPVIASVTAIHKKTNKYIQVLIAENGLP